MKDDKIITPSAANINETAQAADAGGATESAAAVKTKNFGTVRAALVMLAVFTVLCGVLYPLGVTVFAQAAFPYEANGSQITVTLSDGSKWVVGSELIGQQYEDARYLFGRVNTGAPSNLSPESEEYGELLAQRIKERKEKLAAIGYADEEAIPDQLITASGSGLDPHISPDAAYFQIPVIVAARNADGKGMPVAAEDVRKAIDDCTEGRFLGVFGERIVNVLLVNLKLDGLL